MPIVPTNTFRPPPRALTRAIFAAVVVVNLGCFLAAFIMGNRVFDVNREISDRQLFTSEIKELLSMTKDAETGQRGYVITGQEQFLQPYQASVAHLGGQISKFKMKGDLLGLDHRDIDSIALLVELKLGELRATIETRRSKGFDAAAKVIDTQEGKQIMDRLRAECARMISAQDRILAIDRELQDQLSRGRSLVFGAATLVSLLAIGWAFRSIQRVSQSRETYWEHIVRQKELWEVTLKSVGDGVIITDKDGKITFMNDVARTLTGWTIEDALGRPCDEIFNIINEDTRLKVESPIAQVLREGVTVGLANHTLLIRKDGTELAIDDSGAPIRDEANEVKGAVLVFRDFTDHKHTQNTLRQAKVEAEEANVAKDNFLATLSHELRTPLTPVVAMLASWEERSDLDEEMKNDVRMMRRSVDLEARLIDDLLDLTRIVRGKLSLNKEVADVHDLIETAASMYRSDILGKKLQLELNLEADRHHVVADPARMTQVLWNILKNATKFTPEGGAISVNTKNSENGQVTIVVRDTGIGMDHETLQRIFQPFEQGTDENVKRYGGLGLGMAISQALVTAQNGEISAYSEGRGAGSTFTVSLPIVSVPDNAEATSQPPAAEAAQPLQHAHRILLVEDHADTLRVLTKLLEIRGHTVGTAGSVAEAMSQLSEAPYDIMISDIGLPDGTGIDLINQVRQRFGNSMPAIALSGFGMEEDVAKSLEAGFNEHLTKPVNLQRLEAVIHTLSSKS